MKKIKSSINIIFLILLVTILSNAQTRVVSYDKSGQHDFSKYKTFGFYKLELDEKAGKKGVIPGTEVLKKAIEKEMKSKNITLVEENPDLWINIGVSIKNVVQTRESDIRDAPRYMGTRNYHWEAGEIVVREYEEGTVTLDFVDRSKNEMVWQGVAAGTITDNMKKRDKRINSVMAKLFKKFPVK